jgi:hypothetical protein
MANPYRVGIELAMTSDHARVLSALSSSLLGIRPHVGQLIGDFGRLKAAIGGALTAAGGSELLSFLAKGIEHTQGLSHEVTQLQKMLGTGSGADVALARMRA